MSYVITIKRTDKHPPLSGEDFDRLLAGDPSLSRDPSANEIAWVDKSIGKARRIHIAQDHLWTDDLKADDAQRFLSKLRDIAGTLRAEIAGEEGESLEGPSGPLKLKDVVLGGFGLVLAVLLSPLILLWGLIRMPFLLWKLARTIRK